MYLRKIDSRIDFKTVEQLGEFWVDNSNVYGNIHSSDGELLFKIEEADVKTFQSLENSV